MNYIGSKYSLVEFIKESILNTLARNGEERPLNQMVFADLFSGTCVVGGAFKTEGCSVIANDIQYYSYVLSKHILENGHNLDVGRCNALIARLNALDGAEGFIYNNYSRGGTQGNEFTRMYFSDANAKKCDAMRQEIEKWLLCGEIDQNEYCFLLASLINSADKYANTASVYGAFLKKLKKSAQRDMVLSPCPIVYGDGACKAYNKDIAQIIEEVSGDILYLDPPYNSRQYCTNYHLLETVARYDNPEIYGKTGLRRYDGQKSDFCNRAKVAAAFENLIKKANFKYIFLSYNNEGLMSFDAIERIMKKYGKYRVYLKEYRRFKADNARESKADSTVEYLHCLVKK